MFINKILPVVRPSLLLSLALSADDLRSGQLVTKLTDSVGERERRKSSGNIISLGASQFISKLPGRSALGGMRILSDLSNMMLLLSFAAGAHPFERIWNVC